MLLMILGAGSGRGLRRTRPCDRCDSKATTCWRRPARRRWSEAYTSDNAPPSTERRPSDSTAARGPPCAADAPRGRASDRPCSRRRGNPPRRCRTTCADRRRPSSRRRPTPEASSDAGHCGTTLATDGAPAHVEFATSPTAVAAAALAAVPAASDSMALTTADV